MSTENHGKTVGELKASGEARVIGDPKPGDTGVEDTSKSATMMDVEPAAREKIKERVGDVVDEIIDEVVDEKLNERLGITEQTGEEKPSAGTRDSTTTTTKPATGKEDGTLEVNITKDGTVDVRTLPHDIRLSLGEDAKDMTPDELGKIIGKTVIAADTATAKQPTASDEGGAPRLTKGGEPDVRLKENDPTKNPNAKAELEAAGAKNIEKVDEAAGKGGGSK